MYQLNRKALETLHSGYDRGIIEAHVSEREIVDIILQQEIVSYCTSKGCLSFDYNDLQELG